MSFLAGQQAEFDKDVAEWNELMDRAHARWHSPKDDGKLKWAVDKGLRMVEKWAGTGVRLNGWEVK